MSNANSWWSSKDQDKNRYNINDKVMIVALISLFVVILIVVALHIYARFLIRRQARRRSALRRMTMGGAGAAQTHTVEPMPKTGLDPSVIAALPTFVYKNSGRDDDDPGPECAICLTALEEEETARLLPNCKHVFHVECIDMWLHSNSTCPICRSGAEPRAPEEKGQPALESAPPTESLEGAENAVGQSSKAGGSGSNLRLSSFRRILSRDRSGRRLQADVVEDLERQ